MYLDDHVMFCDAYTLYFSGEDKTDKEKAIKIFQTLSDRGSGRASAMCAYCFRGVDNNKITAKYGKKALSSINPFAKGMCYRYGLGDYIGE